MLPGCATPDAPAGPAADEVVFSETPVAWFNAYFTALSVAKDGSALVFDRTRLIDPAAGTASRIALIEAPQAATFDAGGQLIVVGRQGEERGWFRAGETGSSPTRLDPNPNDLPIWSETGRWVAYVNRGGRDREIRIAPATGGDVTSHPLPGPMRSAAWIPGDSVLLVLLAEEAGLGSLHAVDRASGRTRLIAGGLDGPFTTPNLAVSPDARFAWIALASAGTPAPADRHVPDIDRDLDIYRIDLASGERQPVVHTPAEEFAPAIANGFLYWVSIRTDASVVTFPADGGDAVSVAQDVQGPTWRPDSHAIGVTTGGWRLADWALNLDGAVIEIDDDGKAIGVPVPIITGFHEDFSPTWSPDGSWIAYHSHRSANPVAVYEGQGIADDIFLRRPEAPTSDEIRLTDFGWEVGTPDWAPDGRHIVMDTWTRDFATTGERTSIWILEIDPQSGALVGRDRVPLPANAQGSPVMQAWSPVRDEIAVVFAAPNQTATTELWVLDRDGSSARRVHTFEGHQYGGVDWSADGENLIYAAYADGTQQIFSISRSGGEQRQLTRDPANLFHPQASPDGRWVAASRFLTVRQILRRPLPTDPPG